MKHIVQNSPLILSFETEWKNESYLTQWHTKYFLNIALVSFYSKSVSREISKCLHFVSVQVKHIVQNSQLSSLIRKDWKDESYLIQWDTKGFQNIKLVCPYSKSMSSKNSKYRHFASVQMKNTVQNRPFFSLIPNRMREKNERSKLSILDYCVFHLTQKCLYSMVKSLRFNKGALLTQKCLYSMVKAIFVRY